ncbi:DUF2161 domain-containing phosphodiesterase, partial [Phaeobacter sp. J2-8]
MIIPRCISTRALSTAPEQAAQNPVAAGICPARGRSKSGGAARNSPLITAYRQDAIRLAEYLNSHGPSKCGDIRKTTGVAKATQIMADDHYGWFERVSRGVYQLTPRGAEALVTP